MGRVFYPNSGALSHAGLVKTALASSKLKLYKSSLTTSQATTKAEIEAAECDFSGYGTGKVITAWLDPLYDPDGGASIQSGTQQFAFVGEVDPEDDVPNTVGGWFLELAAGGLFAVGEFTEPILIGANGQGVPVDIKLIFPAG